MNIRRATLADIDVLTRLFAGYRAFYGCAADTAAERTFLHARLTLRDAVIFVADSNGFALLYPFQDSLACAPAWLLHDLFVDPAARGQGVGATLLAAVSELARESGASRVELTTAHTNASAQRLYARMGWQRDAVFQTWILVP